ncbi:DUF72 domain-containing protein [Pedobacter jamesrossensis]|uniref:DUF72 domain-containing protein n=1 Tax=Pedobacter jamesrossensis TaxID=1908238 RepID=A0ABV8NKZ3_9SPHI
MTEQSVPKGEFYIGTSGLVLPVGNKTYYPEAFKDKSRLSFYGSLFSSIEINSSFYKIPLSLTVRKWKEQVPSDFRFSFKLFRDITHAKHLIYDPKLITTFMNAISQVEEKAGSLLVQFPPSLKVHDMVNLERLLIDIQSEPTSKKWTVALEFRNADWYKDEVFELANKYKSCMVIHDKGSFGTEYHDNGTNAIYLRMHGPGGNYWESYDEGLLYEYASYVIEWMNKGKTVFVYFNNTMGSAILNLNTLRNAVLNGLV